MTQYDIILKTTAIEVRRYYVGTAEAGSVVCLPPQSGGTCGIADLSEGHSLMQCMIDNNPLDKTIILVNWLTCTHDRRNESYDDVLLQVNDALNATRIVAGEGIHLVGLCQGGALATVFTAALAKDHGITELTIAAAPIDTRAAPGDLDKANSMPLEKYEWMVSKGITPFKSGRMAGEDLLLASKIGNPKKHYWDRYMRLSVGDFSAEKLHQWTSKTQDLAGPFFLKMIEGFFLKNQLVKNEFVAMGKKILLSNIKGVKINLIAGDNDTIVPSANVYALADHVDESCEVWLYTVKGGHLDVFSGSSGLNNQWAEIFDGGTW